MTKKYLYGRILLIPFVLLTVLILHVFIVDFLREEREGIAVSEEYIPFTDRFYQKREKETFFQNLAEKVNFFTKIVFHDFGKLKSNPSQNVFKEVFRRLGLTFFLTVVSVISVFFLSHAIGLFLAVKSGSFIDRFFSFCFAFLYAVPVYAVVPFVIEKIALPSGLPFHGHYTAEIYDTLSPVGKWMDIGKHLFFPYLVFIYGFLAVYSGFTKTVMENILSLDYIKALKIRGVSFSRILFFHIRKASFSIFIPLFSGGMGSFFSGALMIETLFEIDGFGGFYYQALINKDLQVILVSSLVLSFISVTGYFLSDSILYLLDPRIRDHVLYRSDTPFGKKSFY